MNTCGTCTHYEEKCKTGGHCFFNPPLVFMYLDREGNQCWDNSRPYVEAKERACGRFDLAQGGK